MRHALAHRAVVAAQLPSEPTSASGERTMSAMSSSEIEVTSTRVAPLSSMR